MLYTIAASIVWVLTTWFIKTVFYEFDLFMASSFFVPNGIAYVNIPIQDTIELTINIEKSIYSLVLLGLLSALNS